ncbi:uncharacterized protein SPPG_07374 [Spizellomyces punctatus DAOM BR117]|uniref:YetF C-terminal domain-containing protein n=1 Tax=Spizellomyces punctatus (strain DAOM BR117) TaxID=645134 RepID=A0A0L0H941_SPIPD|nr:hypothetical protein, variant 2 [Spizellomyces punctatus DAOM BR117]XP_016605495.1 hypothetical protein, variant 1 [Spizellomyces punctatus DAOM BR117]XP_016605496.1 uncharacterized protein SPPG_07374 [Spizellomyces punctatus DAOM BR117]KNC97454.1 hypothetical protein, variant 2 [Spizellomyces punctatus DAOM BR117]KNC97455.1 hypothetical protein, variant 1 [Spizellomyces punctatus DAOM BR117]KNC97456.1 hypothetical protein SPPG_07374 [Spizellomyces punctatus DAOM BR117]|eukprot:XP_016605494.1 hypothetical protein, variant 2 [Spizellomyces punctatus DAOM BR117]
MSSCPTFTDGPVLSLSDIWRSCGVLHPVVVGTFGFFFLWGTFRLSGPRTLAKVTVTDFLASITIGSTLSRMLTQPDVNLVRGTISLTVILVLEFSFTFLAVRLPQFTRILRNPVRLLVYNGSFIMPSIHANRLSPDDIYGALRQKGYATVSHIEAVFLEPSGEFSIISMQSLRQGGRYEALMAVPEYRRVREADSDRDQLNTETDKSEELAGPDVESAQTYRNLSEPIDTYFSWKSSQRNKKNHVGSRREDLQRVGAE